MAKQPTFPGLRDAMKKKQTRRALFLAEMDGWVPWGRLLALIAPHYPKAGRKGGRPPMAPSSYTTTGDSINSQDSAQIQANAACLFEQGRLNAI